jgi:hypothetical protein
MNVASVHIEAGASIRLGVEIGREELRTMGLELPDGHSAASLVLTVDLERLRHVCKAALTNKGRRATLEGGAIEIRTAGSRPLRDPEPVTVREPEGR